MVYIQSEGTAARRRFPLYLVDATDGITAETGEATGQPQISKNGGAFANTTNTLTAIGNGSYYVELTATELDTLGTITVRYKSANTAEFSMSASVVAMNMMDSVRAGLTALPNAAAEAAGGLYTRGSGAGQINQPANGLIDANVTRFGGTAGTFAGGRPEVNTTHVAGTAQTAVNIKAAIDSAHATATDTLGAVTDGATGVAAIKSDTAAILDDTRTSGVVVAAGSKTGYSLSAAGVQAIWEYSARTLTSFGTLVSDIWSHASRTLTAISDSAGVTTLLSRLTSGRADNLDNLNASVSSRLASADYTAPDNAGVAAIKSLTDKLNDMLQAVGVTGRFQYTEEALALAPAGGGGGATAEEIADAVWDEAGAEHDTPGTMGAALNDAGAAANPWSDDSYDEQVEGTAGHALDQLLGQIEVLLTRVTGRSVNLVQPLGSEIGVMDRTVTQGFDYVGGSALTWSSTEWADLTGATIKLATKATEDAAATLTALNAGNSEQGVMLEMTEEQLDAILAALGYGDLTHAIVERMRIYADYGSLERELFEFSLNVKPGRKPV